MNLEFAKQLIAMAKDEEEAHRENDCMIEVAKVQAGWNDCQWRSEKVSQSIFDCGPKTRIHGWYVSQTNIYTNESQGMFYYSTHENVLLKAGGGTLVLQYGIIITADEIATLNMGMTPSRLIRDRRYNPQTGEIMI